MENKSDLGTNWSVTVANSVMPIKSKVCKKNVDNMSRITAINDLSTTFHIIYMTVNNSVIYST